MKKILFISDMFPHERNTIDGIFVQHQVAEIAKLYEVRVIATHFPAAKKIMTIRQDGLEVLHIDYPQSNICFPLTSIYYYFYVLPQIKKAIREWNPDIIHVHDCRHLPELWTMKWYLDKLLIPKYLTVHNIKTLASQQKLVLRPLYIMTMSKAYRNWTHIFTVNGFLKDILNSYASSVTVIGNAILTRSIVPESEVMQFQNVLPTSSFKIIAVGNLVETKGYDLLIQAIGRLYGQGHDISLIIVGNGPQRAKLQALVVALQLSGRVILQAALPNPIVRNIYQYFDAFVLPSYAETFGIVYLEAMDAGIPVIGVKGQGIDGVIVHEINGLLVGPRSLEDLCHKIAYLMDNPADVAPMVSKANVTVKDYMMPRMIERLAAFYNSN
ncbi:MAG: hypothetical protein CVU48_08475 [Candidatus Cloacimonetes bacterium HGW-Cloacimonetes-1]|jgi:glycosyltransferase involved in cell wall biosynthesis|nr:MAG: hypothetical protein CVU48_08475 [Candidatus Cloacimonetes bacterium HGW-Cloacimonetes-1]